MNAQQRLEAFERGEGLVVEPWRTHKEWLAAHEWALQVSKRARYALHGMGVETPQELSRELLKRAARKLRNFGPHTLRELLAWLNQTACVMCEVNGAFAVPARACRDCGHALCAEHAADPCAPKCVAALFGKGND